MPEQSKPTRVLVNGIHAKSGGGVTYLRNMLPLFANNPALDVHLIIHRDQHAIYEDIGNNIQIHEEDFASGFYRRLIWEQFALPGRVRAIGADVLFSPGNFGPLSVRKQVILLRNALAVGGQEQRLRQRLYWCALTLATWMSLAVAKKPLAVSTYAAQSIAPSWAQKKLQIVHHGVSEAFRAQAPNAGNRDQFLLMVSDIYIQKNIHTVLEALARVRDKNPQIRLQIAGRIIDQTYYEKLCEQIAALKISENVTFLGSQLPDEIKRLYATCRAVVFASTVEAFGNPLLEAMASACPVISSNTTAMPEVAGEAVLYFSPDDSEELASKMQQVLEDGQLCADLSERALKRAQGFSWEKTAAETANVLIQAAGR